MGKFMQSLRLFQQKLLRTSVSAKITQPGTNSQTDTNITQPDTTSAKQDLIDTTQSDPNTAEVDISEDASYRYKPLVEKGSIRLLEIFPGSYGDPIQCSVSGALLKDCPCVWEHHWTCSPRTRHVQPSNHRPHYEALSYVWGDPSARENIYCDSKILSVTSNCASALKTLRFEARKRTIWIDAICINQEDDQEKNGQIQMMAMIYRGAFQVIAYLGEETTATRKALNFIANNSTSELGWFSSPIIYAEDDLRDLFSRPFFRRIWILQEMTWAYSVKVILGSENPGGWTSLSKTEIPWTTLDSFYKIHDFEALDFPIPRVLSMRNDRRMSSQPSPEALLLLLCQARACEATDLRDKVFALLPLFLKAGGKSMPIKVDYTKPVEDCYLDVFRYLLGELGMAALSPVEWTGSELSISTDSAPSSRHKGLASWIPNWSTPCERLCLWELVRCHSGFTNTPGPWDGDYYKFVSQEHLKVRGLIIGEIKTLESPCSMSQNWTGTTFQRWWEAAEQAGTHMLLPFFRMVSMDVNSEDERCERAANDERYRKACGERDDRLRIAMKYDQEWQQNVFPDSHNRTKFHGRISLRCRGRTFCMTEFKDLLLAPLQAQVGDLVVILLSARTPFVVRRSHGRYSCIGECYVEGKMNGEALQDFESSQYSGEDALLPFEDMTLE